MFCSSFLSASRAQKLRGRKSRKDPSDCPTNHISAIKAKTATKLSITKLPVRGLSRNLSSWSCSRLRYKPLPSSVILVSLLNSISTRNHSTFAMTQRVQVHKFEASSPKYSTFNGFWNQKPQIVGHLDRNSPSYFDQYFCAAS